MFNVTKKDLLAIAKNRDIKGRSDMTVDQLKDALVATPSEHDDATIAAVARCFGTMGYHLESDRTVAEMIYSKYGNKYSSALAIGFRADATKEEQQEYVETLAVYKQEILDGKDRRKNRDKASSAKAAPKAKTRYQFNDKFDGFEEKQPKQVEGLAAAAENYDGDFSIEQLGEFAKDKEYIKTKQDGGRISAYYRKNLLDTGVIVAI